MNRRNFLAAALVALPFLREKSAVAQVPGVEFNTPPQDALRLYKPGQANVLYGETAVKGNTPGSTDALIQLNAGRPDTADDPDYAYSPPAIVVSNHTDESAGAVFGNEPNAKGDNFYVQNDSEEGGVGINSRQGTPDHREANGSAIKVEKWSNSGHAIYLEAPEGTGTNGDALMRIYDRSNSPALLMQGRNNKTLAIDPDTGLSFNGAKLFERNGRIWERLVNGTERTIS